MSVCMDSWQGSRIMLLMRMLVAHYDEVLIMSLSMLAISCLMTLGCALVKMHMTSKCLQMLQGIVPQEWEGSDVTSLPWLFYCCQATAAVDSCCTGCYCHGECMLANEETTASGQPLYHRDWPFSLPPPLA